MPFTFDIWTIVLLIAVLVLVVILIWNRQKAKKDREDTLANSVAISTGAGTAQIDVRPYTDRIVSDFNSWSADTALYDELSALNDDIVRGIWLDYDIRYKTNDANAQKGKTLALALYDAYYPTRCCTFGWDWNYHAKLFHDKLKAIGLP